MSTDTSIGVVAGCLPAINITLVNLSASFMFPLGNLEFWTYLTVDELQITWALRIAVSNTILGTSLVARVFGHSTVLVHGDEVKGAVETARKVGNINIKGELVVQQIELLVRSIGIHEIETGTDVGGISTLGNECQLQGVSASLCSVCRLVVSTLESAVGSASCVTWAKSFVPGVASIAVGVRSAGLVVNPSPVRIDNNLSTLGGAAP